jgi:hypothetical protein
VTFDLGRRLLISNAVTTGEVRHAAFDAVTHARPFARALADASPTAREMLARPLVDAPKVSSVVPYREAMDKLPEGLAGRLLAVPVNFDARSGVFDVATVDPNDTHAASEIAFHLQAPVRLVAAALVAIERAVETWDAVRRATANAPPITGDVREEEVMPLVRRGRMSMPPVTQHGAPTPPVAMVFDFSAAAREERDAPPPTQRGAPPAPSKRPIKVPKSPFPSIERAIALIDRAVARDEILDALIKGLLTTAGAAALLAQRKGAFVVLRDGGDYQPKDLPSKPVPLVGAVSEALRRGERIGHLDGLADAELLDALDLRYLGALDVLMHAVSIADRPALILVAFGIGDFAEASKRARLLASAASAGLTAMLRR